MSIIIQNITPDPKPTGKHLYQIRINEKVVVTFDHYREDGLSVCLQKAAEAVFQDEAKYLEATYRR